MTKPLPNERPNSTSARHAPCPSAASHHGESNYGYPNHQDGIQSGNLTGELPEASTEHQREVEQSLPHKPDARQGDKQKKT